MIPSRAQPLLATLLPVGFALGCAGLGDLMNAGALWRYAELVADGVDEPLEVRTCEMLPGSRAGWCELDGDPAAVDALVESLGGRETPAQTGFGEPCLMLYRFSEGEAGGGWQPREGVRRFELDGPLPPNRENVRLKWLYVEPGGTTACLSLEFPYG